jgi:hypothetical protein
MPGRSLIASSSPDENYGYSGWLLTHRDLQHVARLQAFLDFAHRSLRRMQDRFDGRSP